MNALIRDLILRTTGATALGDPEPIQSLWSGYGEIFRIGLEGVSASSVVVKHVRLADPEGHPRGWATDRSHQRKLVSYQVETAWYRDWAARCDATCRVPGCLALEQLGDEVVMVLEDLDASGFGGRRSRVSAADVQAGLSWLASFHAQFLGAEPKGLWPTGTYWHLATRPDEWGVMEAGPLKSAASELDRILSASPFQTIVHGDAKLANFCFASQGEGIAAVDFQYVGGGCGMKDVAYFLGSCLDESTCEQEEVGLLAMYFSSLRAALDRLGSPVDRDALEADWRRLFPVAWTDFHRFLCGWSPGHWKINGYSERLAESVLAALDRGEFAS